MLSTRNLPQNETYTQTKSKGMEKYLIQMEMKIKSAVTILVSDKIGLRTKAKYTTKGAIQEENITLVNIYAPNIGTPKYIKNILVDTKGEIDCDTVILGNFNTPLTSINKSSRQKINKETMALNDTLDQMHLINTFRAFHPKAAEYTSLSSAHKIYILIYLLIMILQLSHSLPHSTPSCPPPPSHIPPL